MLPLHRNDGMEPKRRLAYADFYRMQIVAKKIESGAKREGQSGFRKEDIFFFLFFFAKVQMTKIYIPVALFQL